MSKKQIYATAHQVLDQLALRTQPGPGVTDPALWRKAVRNRLRNEHWDLIVATLDANPTTAPERIVATIEATTTPTPPRPDHSDAIRRALEHQMAENAQRLADNTTAPSLPIDDARQRLHDIRNTLTTSAPRPSQRRASSDDWRTIALVLFDNAHRCDAADFLTDDQLELLHDAVLAATTP